MLRHLFGHEPGVEMSALGRGEVPAGNGAESLPRIHAGQHQHDASWFPSSSSSSTCFFSSSTTTSTQTTNVNKRTSFIPAVPIPIKGVLAGQALNTVEDNQMKVWLFNQYQLIRQNDQRGMDGEAWMRSGSPNGPPEEFAYAADRWAEETQTRVRKAAVAMQFSVAKAQQAVTLAQNATLDAIDAQNQCLCQSGGRHALPIETLHDMYAENAMLKKKVARYIELYKKPAETFAVENLRLQKQLQETKAQLPKENAEGKGEEDGGFFSNASDALFGEDEDSAESGGDNAEAAAGGNSVSNAPAPAGAGGPGTSELELGRTQIGPASARLRRSGNLRKVAADVYRNFFLHEGQGQERTARAPGDGEEQQEPVAVSLA